MKLRFNNKIAKGLTLVLALSFLAAGCNSGQTSQTTPTVSGSNIQSQTQVNPPSINQNTGSGLSNDKYYTNTAGNQVHLPAYSNTVPAGASAICGDGSYSFSQSRQGTCSHHGGVAEWY